MKSTMRGVSVAIAISMLILAGCGDETTPTAPGEGFPAELTGTWNFVSATMDGQSQPLSTVLQWDPSSVAAATTVTTTGAFDYAEMDAGGGVNGTTAGQWRVSGQSMTVRTTHADGQPIIVPEQAGTWLITGNTLAITLDNGGTELGFTLTQ